jgi:murein DD-endopeptidase MepM/ murein hydrolase activator NlpD
VTSDPVATSAVPDNGAPATTGTRPSGDAERQRVKQLAQEFEALLMTRMLREMRHSMLSDEESENGFGNETMTDMVDVELGRALSRAGGFGLSGVLFEAIEQRLKDTTLQTPSATPPSQALPYLLPADPHQQPISVAPASDPGQATPATDGRDLEIPDGRVSSAFGWRRDPFTGVPRFHRGIDVAHAYGQDVRAAAAGQVVFAGDHGAYGTVIVIDHPGGRQTRYAHLAVSGVQPGDRVDAGEVIGKSGNSGHSTGPHLHFEVLEAGRAVDPGAGS